MVFLLEGLPNYPSPSCHIAGTDVRWHGRLPIWGAMELAWSFRYLLCRDTIVGGIGDSCPYSAGRSDAPLPIHRSRSARRLSYKGTGVGTRSRHSIPWRLISILSKCIHGAKCRKSKGTHCYTQSSIGNSVAGDFLLRHTRLSDRSSVAVVVY